MRLSQTYDSEAASSALDAALAAHQQKPSSLKAALAPIEPRIKAALAANMTPTAIAEVLKASGVPASVAAIRAHIKSLAPKVRKKPSNGKAKSGAAE